MSQPLVALIVLTWNQRDLTLDCLDSLAALDYPAQRLEIIVVDNGSTDGTAQAVRERYPTVTVLETGENLGFAGGNNVGLRRALQGEAEYVMLLNNDTVVQPDFASQLVAVAESDRSIGIVGPKMYFADPPDMIFAAGSLVLWDQGRLHHRGIWQRESEVGPLYAEAAEDVDFVVGCGVLFRREVVEQVGLLDLRYYLNYEDVDVCIRAHQAGYRVRYTPRAVLYHKVHAQSRALSQSVGVAGAGQPAQHLLHDPQLTAVFLHVPHRLAAPEGGLAHRWAEPGAHCCLDVEGRIPETCKGQTGCQPPGATRCLPGAFWPHGC